MTTKLQQALDQANGRRRTRLLALDDIVYAASKLRPGKHVFLHGGHVANAYKYPAYATGAVVWIPAGKRSAYCHIRTVSATKGSSGFGRESCWQPDDTFNDSHVTPPHYNDFNRESCLTPIRITPADKRNVEAELKGY